MDRRGEPDLINTLLADPATKVVLTRGGLVAVPRGQGDLVDYENVKMRLATLPGAYVGEELRRYPEAVAMFLGSYGGVRGECVIAIDISRVPDAGEGAVPGAQPNGVLGVQDAGTVDGAMGLANANGNAAGKRAGESGGAAESAAPFGVPDSAGQGADDAFDESVSTRHPRRAEAHTAATGRNAVRLGGFAWICTTRQRAGGRSGHQRGHPEHLA